MTPRIDHATHALVEMGLNFCCHRYAAEFMARNEVPFEVAYRVLLKPSQRRSRGTYIRPAVLDIDLSDGRTTRFVGHMTVELSDSKDIPQPLEQKAEHLYELQMHNSHWHKANTFHGVRYR